MQRGVLKNWKFKNSKSHLKFSGTPIVFRQKHIQHWRVTPCQIPRRGGLRGPQTPLPQVGESWKRESSVTVTLRLARPHVCADWTARLTTHHLPDWRASAPDGDDLAENNHLPPSICNLGKLPLSPSRHGPLKSTACCKYLRLCKEVKKKIKINTQR